MPNVFTEGIYSMKDAREILGISHQLLWSWFIRRKRQHTRLQSPSYEPIDGEQGLTFYDLVEAWVAVKLVEAGMPRHEVLRNHSLLEAEYGPHPFSKQTILGSWLGCAVETKGSTGATIYREPRTKQLINPSMARQLMTRIKWGQDDLAEQIEPQIGIILNPKFGFGQPVTKKNKFRTYILYKAWIAQGRKYREVAKWYDITPSEVKHAVAYEQQRLKAP